MLNLTYLPIAKMGAQIVAGLGIQKIASDIIQNNVAITTTTQKVMVKVGGFVLGSMLWEQSSNHIERQVNDVVTWLESKNLAKNETEK